MHISSDFNWICGFRKIPASQTVLVLISFLIARTLKLNEILLFQKKKIKNGDNSFDFSEKYELFAQEHRVF